MKKTLIALAALAMVAACNKAEVIEVPQGDAIAFENPFVDNATKATATDPSYGAVDFTKFQVWGTANDVAIFNGNDVEGVVGEGNEWSCSNKQYWIEGVKYDFAAVANGKVESLANGLPATISYTANGTSDLVYAESKNITGQPAGSNVPVALTFSHLLAKVKFTATTNTNVEGYSYTVSDITIKNAYDSGVYTVEGTSWGTLAKTNGQAFGSITVDMNTKSSECAQEKLLIPIAVADKINIACKVTLNFNGEKIWEDTPNVTVNTGLAPANAYNFTIALNVGEEIKFSVVKGPSWTTNGDITIQ